MNRTTGTMCSPIISGPDGIKMQVSLQNVPSNCLSINDTDTNKYKISGYLPFQNVYIKEVIYSKPATIVFWSDKTKTVAKCSGDDVYSEETGLTICVLKKLLGATQVKKLFKEWVPEQTSLLPQKITLLDIMKKYK